MPRTRYRWDEKTKTLIEVGSDWQPSERALHAPVMVDRWLEGSVAPDGTDVGNRQKREEWMRRNDCTDARDYANPRFQEQLAKRKAFKAQEQRKERLHLLGSEWEAHSKRNR